MTNKLSRRLSHVGLWLLNGAIAASIFPPMADSPVSIASFCAGFLVLDLLAYAFHRAQHCVPLMWRFHALHHSDPEIDASTAVRNHPGDAIPATAVLWVGGTALGISNTVMVGYTAVLLVLALASHTKVSWPAWLERVLQPLLVTLDLHLVHHSINPADAGSNFGGVLSIWDRLFGTFAPAHPVAAFGLAGFDRTQAHRPIAMLLTPWRIK